MQGFSSFSNPWAKEIAILYPLPCLPPPPPPASEAFDKALKLEAIVEAVAEISKVVHLLEAFVGGPPSCVLDFWSSLLARLPSGKVALVRHLIPYANLSS